MGFLSNLIDDVADSAASVVRAPVRIMCSVAGDHDWQWDWRAKTYRCDTCGKTSERRR